MNNKGLRIDPWGTPTNLQVFFVVLVFGSMAYLKSLRVKTSPRFLVNLLRFSGTLWTSRSREHKGLWHPNPSTHRQAYCQVGELQSKRRGDP